MGLGLEHRLTAASDLILPLGQSGKEAVEPFLHCLLGPQAEIAGSLLSGLAPDSFISTEIRAVTWQT